MSWFNPLAWFKRKEAEVIMTAQPISVQVTSTSAVVMKRHAGRLCRLLWLKENGDATPEIISEIEKLGYLLAAQGNPIPKSLKAAELLRKKLGG
jgi:hypothetical protein